MWCGILLEVTILQREFREGKKNRNLCAHSLIEVINYLYFKVLASLAPQIISRRVYNF